jgi:selenocysteine lyase/cysteine desulfurase
MTSKVNNRRAFLTAVTTGAASGLLADTFFSKTANATSPPSSASEYLIADGVAYMNTGTLGPCRRETIEASMKAWDELETLPVKFYGKFGAEELAEKTRATAARFLGCDIGEIVITNSTTNGMNAVAQGLRLKAGDRILTTDQEHGGGLLGWKYFEKYYGVKVDSVAIPKNDTTAAEILDRVDKATTQNTKLISASHVFSSTGLRLPIAEISKLARSKGILFIVDGAQAAGAIKVNVKALGCHAYATSGHKWLMGPKGTGLLYISKDAQSLIRPIQFEESFNTYNDGNGVVNLACILGLAKAIEYLESVGIDKIEAHNVALRNRLCDRVKNIPNLMPMGPSSGNPLASPMLALLLSDKFRKGAFVTMLMDKYKLSIRPTHAEFGFNGIRFSMHIFNSEKEVERAAEILRSELT